MKITIRYLSQSAWHELYELLAENAGDPTDDDARSVINDQVFDTLPETEITLEDASETSIDHFTRYLMTDCIDGRLYVCMEANDVKKEGLIYPKDQGLEFEEFESTVPG